MTSPASKRHSFRHDPSEAAAVLAGIVTDSTARARALAILAEAINRANRIAPASWGVSLFPDRLCFNVGRGAVLQFYPDEVMFTVTGKGLNTVPAPSRRAFRINQTYRFVEDAVEGALRLNDLGLYSSLAAIHMDLVERAAQGRRICFWKDAHSPGVVGVLREAGHRVPDPDYVTDEPVLNVAPVPDLDELDRETSEGRRTLRTHLKLERDSGLADRKKRWARAAHGKLGCEVCGFDFVQRYGSIGDGFAEIHHNSPLGASKGIRKTTLRDLAIVCSNCHRMLHRGTPLFSISELRARLLPPVKGIRSARVPARLKGGH